MSDDQLSGFWMDSELKLYAKGNNEFGQLGIGKENKNIG